VIVEIREDAIERGVTRVCHFTQGRSLMHIIRDGNGIIATAKLRELQNAILNPTDTNRYDGRLDCVCCSIQYPNVYYLNIVQSRLSLFKDWVVLLVKPDYLWMEETAFCPMNASAGRGVYVSEGYSTYADLYSGQCTDSQGRTFVRSKSHLSACPTNIQAEVLIRGHIDEKDITGIVVRTQSQAKRYSVQCKLAGLDNRFPLIVAPDFYDPQKLSRMIRTGERPSEKVLE